MEVELETRVKPLPYKVKATSRESPAQKAAHVLDTDLRNHWSTGTNTKEWILLELDEPCLLSHVRIYNKSVLEWEISAGLRYKPESFAKVRPRCEAPRRDMIYPLSYTPCRYVRISCMRGNPIALFFIQLIGIPVPGLEPEFQPVANHLLPDIISHKHDAVDMHLQLLQDVTSRLVRFLPHLEADLNSFAESSESTMRFLAMLAGPFYPILQIVSERENARLALSTSDYEIAKTNTPSTVLMVSSNFEPRRSRNASSASAPMSMHLVFRPDAVFLLLRKAYKDSNLGNVCRMASRIFLKLVEPLTAQEVATVPSDVSPIMDETPKSYLCDMTHLTMPDYSSLFGEEFQIPDDFCDHAYLNILDFAVVEEGIMHVLYASASQPLHCSKLAENTSEFWLALPLVQALLPALRPIVSSSYQIDDNFTLWKQPFTQNALSQIVATSSSVIYRPLLRVCAGYLASFSLSHAKAACLLIDLCSGVLAPWMAQVIAKVDLCLELLEDLLGVIQGARHSFSRARAALKYIILALSGNMDDIMAKYKDAKHWLLFLVEMLEPFLDPSLTPLKGMIAFGNVSSIFSENQEQNCARALNVIRAAIRKPSVLPSLESEWRHGSVAPSVLLSVLDAQLQLPLDIDNCKFSSSETVESHPEVGLSLPSCNGVVSSRSNNQEVADVKVDVDISGKMDISDDASLFFASPELNRMSLTCVPASSDMKISDPSNVKVNLETNSIIQNNVGNNFANNVSVDADPGTEFYNLLADYSQLMNYRDCELRASEFRRLALDLRSLNGYSKDNHEVTIGALLLAAECYVNPCFMMSFKDYSRDVSNVFAKNSSKNYEPADIDRIFRQSNGLKLLVDIERKRDRVVLEILIEAAELDKKYGEAASEGEISGLCVEGDEDVILSELDCLSADAVTLVRQNQALLCNFLTHHLLRNSHEEEQPVHEVLMWSLLFLLQSATKLFCTPEHVVDIILNFAESLNMQLKALYYQLQAGNSQLNHLKQCELQRRWILLHRLVIASSGGDERSVPSINIRNGFQFANLIPPSVWLQKVPAFSSSTFPLVRYFGWMAIAHNAKQFLKEKLFLVSDLKQLSYLLLIFSDDLSLVHNFIEKDMDKEIEKVSICQDVNTENGRKNLGHQDELQSFHALYPDIFKFFPNLKKEFIAFGETILGAVGLQLRFLSSSIVPDLMCWFSELCSWPFVQSKNGQTKFEHRPDYFKGFVAKNAKAVILYILESIVVEHMEAMIPEMPRVVQVFVSLCRTSYCDVSFLDSILCLLKPIIAYSLNKVSDKENSLAVDSCDNFESLCLGELFDNIRYSGKDQDAPMENRKYQALTIYVLAAIFGDLSLHRKKELLQSATVWAEFSMVEGPSFHDYICAYQVLMENCKVVLLATLRFWDVIPLKVSSHSDTATCSDAQSSKSTSFLLDICNPSSPTERSEKDQGDKNAVIGATEKVCQLNLEEIKCFCENLEALILKLYPTLDECWKLHHKLTQKLALTCAECFVYSRCLFLVRDKVFGPSGGDLPSNFLNELPEFWKASLKGLSEMILILQEKRCWEVASVLLYSLLGVNQCFHLDHVIDDICLALKSFSNNAPNISWRLQIDKMLFLLLGRGIQNICQNEVPLNDFFCTLLGHPEPEQRYIALKHLGRLVGQDVDGGSLLLSSTTESMIASSDLVTSASEPILSPLVSATWDHVALIASSDTSLLLRTHATSLLISFIPFADRSKLQSFLAASDSILQCLTTLAQPTCDGPLTQFSLALIASVCLYTPADDISLIPEGIWRNIETSGMTRNGRYCTSLEKKACEALCKLRSDGEQAKQFLKEVLCSSSGKLQNPDFATMRQSILQVIGNLTSARSYFDFFSKEVDEKTMELEEAEMEMELLQSERPQSNSNIDFHDWRRLPFLSNAKDDQRLQQIKDEIKSIEKAKLREEIVVRRQQKLLMRRARQQFLEEATSREAELIQKLDSVRADEAEKELERQQQLELERAKTRELQHNLDLEKEKQAQRDLQRELEQVESGVRPSRREFSSSNQSRARDRYRERESNSRDGSNEGNLRAGSRGVQPDTLPSTMMLSGSRSFSILQARERSDDCSSSYEESFEGSKESGDTGSVGDPDAEGQAVGLGSRGMRGGKSRQIIERRERDGRREGKWERKH